MRQSDRYKKLLEEVRHVVGSLERTMDRADDRAKELTPEQMVAYRAAMFESAARHAAEDLRAAVEALEGG